MLIDTPVLALTGTASTKMPDHVTKSLSMKKGTLTIFVSPNRENIRLSVVKVKQEKYLANLSWLVSIMQEKREETPKKSYFAILCKIWHQFLDPCLPVFETTPMLLGGTKYWQTELWDLSIL